MSDLSSRPYRPDSDVCCERCVFGSGPHAAWCEAQDDTLAMQLVRAGFEVVRLELP